MVNPIHQIAKLITEHPDTISHNILLESLENKIKKLLTKISNQLPHEINIDEITQFATQQRFKEAGVSRWIAKQVAFNPNLRVDWQSLIDYIVHLKFRDNNKYKILLKNNIQEAIKDAEEWHSQFQVNDDVIMTNDEPIITEFPNGYRIVKLIKKEHCEAEGKVMGHCVGTYNPKETDLYSLRSPDGKPKVTIQILEDGRINQIKGRQNEPPVKKYAKLIIPWVNSILRNSKKLFDDPKVNFTMDGFDDYVGSLYDQDLLSKLAKDKNSQIRCAVAKNTHTSKNILRLLGQDREYGVISAVANNPKIPADIIKLLSQNNDIYIRTAIARNPSTPTNILDLLSKDFNSSVRIGVAGNPSTPINILDSLSKDLNQLVLLEVAENPNASPNILRFLSKNPSVIITWAIAANPSSPADVLKLLSKDECWSIRDAVAENPSTPVDILRILSKDDNIHVRSSVAENPSAPADILNL